MHDCVFAPELCQDPEPVLKVFLLTLPTLVDPGDPQHLGTRIHNFCQCGNSIEPGIPTICNSIVLVTEIQARHTFFPGCLHLD